MIFPVKKNNIVNVLLFHDLLSNYTATLIICIYIYIPKTTLVEPDELHIENMQTFSSSYTRSWLTFGLKVPLEILIRGLVFLRRSDVD